MSFDEMYIMLLCSGEWWVSELGLGIWHGGKRIKNIYISSNEILSYYR